MQLPTFRLRVSRGPRDLDRFPRRDDDALGESVFALLDAALDRGLPRPAILALHEAEVEQFDIVPLLEAQPADRERLLAAIAGGRPGVECAVLAGVLNVTMLRGKAPARAAVVYVEWPDNRWWTAWQLVGADRQLVGDEPVIRRAVDGWPRPGGVGGWFALARRQGLSLVLRPPAGLEGLGLVH